MFREMTEDEVRDYANTILKFKNEKDVKAGVGQLTSFNLLGFVGVKDRPDGWYLPDNKNNTAIILEAKSSSSILNENHKNETNTTKKNTAHCLCLGKSCRDLFR